MDLFMLKIKIITYAHRVRSSHSPRSSTITGQVPARKNTVPASTCVLTAPYAATVWVKAHRKKKISVTYYRAEYQRNIARVESPQGRYMKGKRQSTVEPVLGTLTQFMGLRKVNTIGLKQANKCMQLSAIAYNLKTCLPQAGIPEVY